MSIYRQIDCMFQKVCKQLRPKKNYSRIEECGLLFKPKGIRRDLNTLEKWTYRNLMKFSEEKCQVLHWGQITPHTNTYCRLTEWKGAGKQFFSRRALEYWQSTC